MVMTGAFDDVLAEDAGGSELEVTARDSEPAGDPSVEGEPGRRRRRRRRRGRRSRGGDDRSSDQALDPAHRSREALSSDAEADEEEVSGSPDKPQEPRPAMRVHEIAKDLGVSSREVIERCQSEEGMEVKNHFSRIAGELVSTVYGWFASVGRTQRHQPRVDDALEPADQPRDVEPSSAPITDETPVRGAESIVDVPSPESGEERRGRRRSRRRRRRGRGGEGRDGAGVRMSWSGAPVTDEGLPAPAGGDAESSSRSDGVARDDRPTLSADHSDRVDLEDAPSGAPDGGGRDGDDGSIVGGSRRRRGRRGRRGRGGKGGGRDGRPRANDAPPSAEHARSAPIAATGPSPVASSVGSNDSGKPRRTLYRNRSKISKAARDAAAKLAKP
jgi:hypothetical protein